MTSNPRSKSLLATPGVSVPVVTRSPASPPSSSDDSPTTSTNDATYFVDDVEMLDYDEYTHLGTNASSPDALFFGARTSSRFTSTQGSPEEFSPFSAGMALKGHSPELEAEGDSPGLGSEMRGLRLNSQFPSPVQGTVRLEDVMLPNETMDTEMDGSMPSVTGQIFENKPDDQHVEHQHVGHGLYQSYFIPCIWTNDCRPPYTLALLGIPPNGAKSRVETQIKLDLQLLHPGTDESVKNVYNYIKLPSYGVSKEKFRLKNLKGTKLNPLIKLIALVCSVLIMF
jgi:hypothetical protein